jgi:hypothetical protein
MTNEDLDRIASSLGTQLPTEYSSLWKGPLPVAPGFEGYLIDDASAIVGINHELRTGEFAHEWDHRRFIVGNGAAGDLFFIILTDEAPAVYAWDHETHETRTVADSLSAFANAIEVGAEIDE